MTHNQTRSSAILHSIERGAAMLAAIVASFCGIGCQGIYWFTGTGEYGGYVMRMGGPKQVTDWTLSQVDDEKIMNGIDGLRNYSCSAQGPIRDAAFAGIKRVHGKLLSGWPGYTRVREGRTGPLSEEARREDIDYVLGVVYGDVLNDLARLRALVTDGFAMKY